MNVYLLFIDNKKNFSQLIWHVSEVASLYTNTQEVSFHNNC